LPKGIRPEQVRRSSNPDRYRSSIEIQIELEPNVGKPDPAVVKSVLLAMDADPESSLMVGDSLTKDISMAQKALISERARKIGRRFATSECGHIRNESVNRKL
jgi:phosphoglycolate phosphatase-like HAD superfamily hydrolase